MGTDYLIRLTVNDVKANFGDVLVKTNGGPVLLHKNVSRWPTDIYELST